MADKYSAVVVKTHKGVVDTFVMGYAPSDVCIYPGDKVTLENGIEGCVLLVDDYVTFEGLQEIEKNTAEEFAKIVETFRKKNVKWEDE